ncbi:MAG TPA: EamA family transporter [Anaerolineae bacterium]|nr:EamA family transporter [Anaerolineae bacterium]
MSSITANSVIVGEERQRWLAIGAGVLATLIWGSTFVIVKFSLEDMGVLTMAGLRYVIAFMVLLPGVIRYRGEWQKWPRGVWYRLALLGVATYMVGTGAMFWSLRTLSAGLASLLMGLVPLLVLILEQVWLGQRPLPRQIIGVLISLIGLGLFVMPNQFIADPFGLFLIGVATFAFVLFAVLGRETTQYYPIPTFLLTAWPFFFGGVGMMLVAMVVEGAPQATAAGWFWIMVMGVVNTAVAYLFYNYALQTLTALQLNALVYSSPIVTALLAFLVLGEVVTGWQAVAIGLVVLGVIRVQ